MNLNTRGKLLQLSTQCDALWPEHKLVELLTLVGAHDESRVHILLDEEVVEYQHVWDAAIPRVVLERRRRGAAGAIQDNMWKVLTCESFSLRYGDRVAGGKRTEYCRQGSLTSAVLSIHER